MNLTTLTYKRFTAGLLNLVLILSMNALQAQAGPSANDKLLKTEEIKDLSDLARYDKTVKKLRSKKRKNKDDDKKEKPEDEEVQPQSNGSFGVGPIFTGILYVLIAALVIFILFTIFSSIKVDERIKKEDSPIAEKIEDLEVIDAESGLELALKAGNFREAVRMLFIKLLQVLVLEKSIEWKSEKTNRDYLREMRNHPKIQHFNNLVIAYERIWYGSEPIDKLFFDYLRTDFDKFYSTENINLDVEE